MSYKVYSSHTGTSFGRSFYTRNQAAQYTLECGGAAIDYTIREIEDWHVGDRVELDYTQQVGTITHCDYATSRYTVVWDYAPTPMRYDFDELIRVRNGLDLMLGLLP